MKNSYSKQTNNSMQRKFRLRVMYSKNLSVCCLSHLEVARALEKTIRRSKLNFCVSNGYSPHMRISFGRALNVGVACQNEIFDIYLRDYIADNKALLALQGVQCDGLPILDCWYVDNKAPAPSCEYIGAEYKVLMDCNIDPNIDICIPRLITVKKKKKEKQIVVADFFEGNINFENNEKNQTLISFCLKVNNGASIRPDLFVATMLSNHSNKSSNIIFINKKNIFNFLEH